MTPRHSSPTAAKTSDTSFCGTKPITLGVHDGFGINGWSRASMAAVRSEAAKCPNVKQVARIGQGDLQKSIADVNGMVSEGIDALAIIPDWGKSQLPSLRAATEAGVKTVPWGADPGGQDGTDYVDYLDWNEHRGRRRLGRMGRQGHQGRGQCGVPRRPRRQPGQRARAGGVVEAFKKYPKITLLTGDKDWPVTNWDASLIQQNITALLGKYPKIDAVINDSDGFAALGVVARLPKRQQAARAPRFVGSERVGLRISESSKGMPTRASRSVPSRAATGSGCVAARKAIAAARRAL